MLVLLKAGASVSLSTNSGWLPIHFAAQENRVEIVRTLLDYGCSPEMVSCCDDTKTPKTSSLLFKLNIRRGQTPLMFAAEAAADETVHYEL